MAPMTLWHMINQFQVLCNNMHTSLCYFGIPWFLRYFHIAHRLCGVRHRSVIHPTATTTSSIRGKSISISDSSNSGGRSDGNSSSDGNNSSNYQHTQRLASVPDARMHRVGALSWLVGFRIAVLSAVAVASLAGNPPNLSYYLFDHLHLPPITTFTVTW